MNRRSLDVEGCVNFPTDGHSTNEGGMVVKLWVVDRREFDERYGICIGADFCEIESEVFVGTDEETYPSFDDCKFDENTLELEQKAMEKFHNKFFDSVGGGGISVPLLASITLGSTGWSNGDFRCKYSDLNNLGREIYHVMKSLYPKAEIHLMTFLDT